MLRKLAHSRALVLLPVAAISYSAAQAQEVIAPPISNQPSPTPEQAAANRVGSIAAPDIRRPETGTSPLQWGPLHFIPRLSYQLVYGTGILEANSSEKTTVHTIAPGLQIEMGRFWDLDFAVGMTRYSNAEFNNSIGYSLGLSGNIPLDEWTLSMGVSSSLSDSPRVETGTQTEQLSHVLSFGAFYTYSDLFSIDTGVSASTRQTQEYSDYWEFSTAEWLNYHVTERTTFGVGIAAGYNIVEPGQDSLYGRPQVRWAWHPGLRLSTQLSVGVQFQKFYQEGGREDLELPDPDGNFPTNEDELGIYPTFDGSLVYKVSDPLSVSLNASHGIENSILIDQFSETTSVGAGASQRLLRYLYLNLSAGYQFQQFRSTTQSLEVAREDEYFSVNVGLSTRLFRKLDTSIFYQYSDNKSDEDEFAFASNQVGLQLSYRF